MVMAESDPEQCPITEKLALLEGVYSCVQYGSCPGLDPAHTACLLRSCLGSHSPAHTAGASALELSCVSVTVMDTLLSTLMSRCATPQFRLFVEETLTLIYQTDVMHQLLRQFEAEEQLVAHLSAKCVAASVLYELHQTSLVSGLWRQKCVDAFHSSPNCICLNSCVWSVTEVLIQLLKGAHQEPVAVEACLQSLWDVLKRCSAQLEVSPHCCCWLSSVFGEQDDDMMEAAKALLVIFLYHRWIATPLAAVAGVKERIWLKAEENPLLELYYRSRSRNPTQADIVGLSKKSRLAIREVERWFRRQRCLDRPGVLKKFREASWRFAFYLSAFVGGILALYDKEWFYETREVWTGFPKQSMLDSQYWYYVMEMSFYGSLLLSVAFDVRRKDFKEQIVHHCATLVLLSFSWCVNYIRVGTLVMLVHDASDVLLESAKLFNYAKWEKTCQTLFVLFALVFMVTRLIIFPFWLIHCTWVYPVLHYPAFFGYYFFNVILLVLLCLHIFWAYLILCMIRKFLFGRLTQDERSDNESEDESSPSEEEVLGQQNAVHDENKNGCFGHLSPPQNLCLSKTVY